MVSKFQNPQESRCYVRFHCLHSVREKSVNETKVEVHQTQKGFKDYMTLILETFISLHVAAISIQSQGAWEGGRLLTREDGGKKPGWRLIFL